MPSSSPVALSVKKAGFDAFSRPFIVIFERCYQPNLHFFNGF